MKKSRGFTLVELMVSVALVASVVSMSTSAYLVMIALNREAQAQATGINNLSYALETMIRTIRSGNTYQVVPCGAGDGLMVNNPDGSETTYCREVNGTRGRITQNEASLTDPAIDITSFGFDLDGELKANDPVQANVKIVIKGKVNVGAGKDREFAVETLAVMRTIDL